MNIAVPICGTNILLYSCRLHNYLNTMTIMLFYLHLESFMWCSTIGSDKESTLTPEDDSSGHLQS